MARSRRSLVQTRRPAQRKADASLSPNCRCACGYYAFITGPAKIPKGKIKTYSSNVERWRNSGCKQTTSGCEHQDTTWTLIGDTNGVSLTNKKKTSVKVKVAADAKSKRFKLKATPKARCRCKGTNAWVACTATANEVPIGVT